MLQIGLVGPLLEVSCSIPHRLYLIVLFSLRMMTSSNGIIVRVTIHLCGEFTGPRWYYTHKGQWRGTFMFSLICARINDWVNNGDAGDLRRHRTHYNVNIMAHYSSPIQYESMLTHYAELSIKIGKNWWISHNNEANIYSISQEICTRFLLCCALLWLYIDWFFHIHQAYFTGTVAI